MIDRFEEVLHLFGNCLDLPLHVDKNNACAIQVQGTIIQMQTDTSQEKLLIGCKIIEVGPGKFREHVLREALKANDLPDPRVGIFAYIASINTLFLFQEYPFDLLTTGERVAGLLGPFIKTCTDWKNAIQNGQAGPMRHR
ncbi:MAG TPA: CesT family type III secretion system chaperone [Chlamydiales bacterium]|jgi:hypothetical protein|nr:CesT family type III secretion system chaperone [Chlamydiales bacterium]